eukprot:4045572-Alexandrium_andersonii.AAC.1
MQHTRGSMLADWSPNTKTRSLREPLPRHAAFATRAPEAWPTAPVPPMRHPGRLCMGLAGLPA